MCFEPGYLELGAPQSHGHVPVFGTKIVKYEKNEKEERCRSVNHEMISVGLMIDRFFLHCDVTLYEANVMKT